MIKIQITENGSSYRIDNEQILYEKITFQNMPAYLGHGITKNNSDTYVMIWVKDGIEHLVYGDMNLSELFEIAENIY